MVTCDNSKLTTAKAIRQAVMVSQGEVVTTQKHNSKHEAFVKCYEYLLVSLKCCDCATAL